MIFKNLNPNLSSDILNNAGFKFDGYYYVHPDYPIRFNKDEKGYTVTFSDPSAPQLNESITTYCELISLMTKALNLVLGKKLSDKKFNNQKEQLEYVAGVIKQIFAFDKNIQFIAMTSPITGFQLSANNEYTFTLTTGDIRSVAIDYSVIKNAMTDPVTEKYRLEIEVSLQCISWPFLMNVVAESLDGFDSSNDKIEINKVYLIDDNKEIPFFGMGIPTIHKNKEG